jgi:hypothetical protein
MDLTSSLLLVVFVLLNPSLHTIGAFLLLSFVYQPVGQALELPTLDRSIDSNDLEDHTTE